MSGKERYGGAKGIPMLLSKTPSYLGWKLVKGGFVEAASAFYPPKHT